MSGTWDKPCLELKDLTKEQLIAHCEREASWHRVHGRATDDELKRKIEKLERDLYNQGYALDKIWLGLADYGGMDPKTMVTENPRPVASAFWRIIGRLKEAEGKVWATPAFSDGQVLLRSTTKGVCVEL